MRTKVALLILLLMTIGLQAQEKEIIHLWPGAVPGENNPKKPSVIDNSRGEENTIITEVTDPVLEVFLPGNGSRQNTGIIVCPGGSYRLLSIDKEGYEIASWLNGLGYSVFVLQYRVPQKREGALQDIQRAVRIVRNYPGIDRVGILGFSAGGSLCARASTRYKDRTYPEIDELDTRSCKPDFSVLIYPAYLDEGENRSLTPELKVTSETPPMFIFGTLDDKHGNSALVMTGALRDTGVPAELHMLAEGGHGYGLRKGNRAAETWPQLCESWFTWLRRKVPAR